MSQKRNLKKFKEILYVPPDDARYNVGTIPSQKAWKEKTKYDLLINNLYVYSYKEILERVAEPTNEIKAYTIFPSRK